MSTDALRAELPDVVRQVSDHYRHRWPDGAEDLEQEVALLALEFMAVYDPAVHYPFRAWIYQRVTSKMSRKLAKRRPAVGIRLPEALPARDLQPDQLADVNEQLGMRGLAGYRDIDPES